ncbi:MAG TPA: hypothetical protein VLW65_20690 [Bryobacteraceae bacterium]|nr:hypothetical protein [Bryobacteraceae bacterium]
MIALAWILTLAAATRIDLVDEVYSIPPNQWRYIEVGLKQQPALVLAHYEVSGQSAGVRMALMRREDMENLREGLPHGVVESAGGGRSGTLHALVVPGEYVIVLDNDSADGRAAAVHLRVWLDFSKAPTVAQISPTRQLIVIFVSFAVFFGIVGYAMAKMWRSMKGHE